MNEKLVRKQIVVLLLLMSFMTFAQENVNVVESVKKYDIKASFKDGDLGGCILTTIDYPLNARLNLEEGFVILSFIIKKDGSIDSILPIEFPSKELAISAILALEKTNNKWYPTFLNGSPIDFKYKLSIRYSLILLNSQSSNLSKADKQVENGNYSKAITFYDRAIADDPYSDNLYLKRYLAKIKIGDSFGAKVDSLKMIGLQRDFIAFFNVNAIGNFGME